MSDKGLNDTIAAVATAPGEGSVSIIRISGENALSIADRLVRCALPCPSERPSHTVVYGHVMEGDIALDEALCLIMRGPNSYTREDVVEIQGHGGSETTRRVLRACLEAGARLAEPGEFTKRAFLNGRIDLTQAEAVLDLVQARSDRAATAALEQLRGGLSQTFDRLYEDVLMETARLEAALDFPEDELPETVLPNIATALGLAIDILDSTLADWDEGTWLRDGILVVISGEPNVGKSTLLNALLKQERAIVTNIPGTTRDAIEENFILEGFPVRIVDTAGLRDTDEQVEQIGIERARKVRGEADFHLVVYDSSQVIDLSLLENLRPDRCLIILNKADLAEPEVPKELAPYPILRSAILLGQGVDEIRAALRDQIASRLDLEARPHAVISERHRELLVACRGHLADAKRLTATGDDEQIFMAAASARDALEALGEATGKVFHEALLDRIFSSFCIGK